jgi:hypothetical protein
MITADEVRDLMPKIEVDSKLVDAIMMQLEVKIKIEAYKGETQINDIFASFILLNRPTLRQLLNRLHLAGFILISNSRPAKACNPDYTLIWD